MRFLPMGTSVPASCYTQAVWPIMASLRLLGCLPLRRRPGHLEWRLCSRHALYCGLVQALQLAVSVAMLHQGLEEASQTATGEMKAFFYLKLFFFSTPMLLGPMITSQLSSHLKLCSEWHQFQLGYERVCGSRLTLGSGRLVRGALLGTLLHAAIVVLTRPVMVAAAPDVQDLVHVLGMSYEVLLIAWWIATCRATRQASSSLLNHYQLLCRRANSGSAALSTRPLWLQLCRLVVRSGDALALPQGTLLVFGFTYILVPSYYLLLVSDLHTRLVLVALVLMCTTALVSHCRAAHQTNVQVGQDLMDALHNTKQLASCDYERDIMQKFLLRLIRTSPKINLGGYMEVGKGLLSTLFSGLVSSLVVLQQLNLLQTSLSYDELKSAVL